MMTSCKVSVCVTAFNLEKYIQETIESAVSQRTSFDYEIVVSDDASTDRTKEIVEVLCQKYPDKIRLISNPINLGLVGNFVQTLQACKGEYIALLDGDDRWTDTSKLQKQVEYLEKNPYFAGCIHSCDIIDERGALVERAWFTIDKEILFQDDIFKMESTYPTSSLIFRSECLAKLPAWFSFDSYKLKINDWILDLCITDGAPLAYMKDCMSAYRIRRNSIHSAISKVQQKINKVDACFALLRNNIFGGLYNSKLRARIGHLAFEITQATIGKETNVFKRFALMYLKYGIFSHKTRFVNNLGGYILFPNAWKMVKGWLNAKPDIYEEEEEFAFINI